MARVFLSYARADVERVEPLAAALERAGHELWWDRRIGGGAEFSREIEAALDRAEAVLVLWSKMSVDSAWVRDEAAAARDTGRLVPLCLDGTSPPLGFRQYHAIDLQRWDQRPSDAALEPVERAIAERASRGATPVAAAPRLAAMPERPPPSVAVLPFANLTGDANKDYLGDGIAEEIITTLSQARGLKVPARTSTFAYKGRGADIRRIATELGVETVLEGSVRTAGERIRVTAQLIDAETGFHIWSQNYDRELLNLFDLQDEIARSIAETLKAKLGLSERRPVDPVAYNLYLQAAALTMRLNGENLAHTFDLFEQAIARDPDFANAWVRHAGALLIGSVTGLLPLAVRDEARAKAEQALRLDSDLAEARIVFGALAGLQARWIEAETEFDAVIAHDARDSNSYISKAYYVRTPCGHLAAAQALTQRAFELAPAEPLTSLGRATLAGLHGDEPAALAHLQSAMMMGLSVNEPGIRIMFAEDAMRSGRCDEAAGHVAVMLPSPALAKDGGEVAALICRARTGSASVAEASDAILRLLDSDDQIWRYQAPVGLMIKWQVNLGAIDAAFAVADRFIADWRRTGQLATLGLIPMWLPEMRPFREDARFQDFVEKLGMFAYWERYGPPDGHELRGGTLVCL